MVKVVAIGTFDMLHLGHIKYLEFAKDKGDKLVVVITSQYKARAKGTVNTPEVRGELVEALGCVDEIYLPKKFEPIKNNGCIIP